MQYRRDIFLDFLKGMAILTVAAGHTLQSVGPNFDENLPFRVIYAFHMPMFIFVSGMVAAITFSKRLTAGANPSVFIDSLGRSASRLLIPFFAWAVVSFYFQQTTTNDLGRWLLLVVSQPDNALWFLWILFQCHSVLALAAAGLLAWHMGRSTKVSPLRLVPLAFGAVLLLSFWPGSKLSSISGIYLTRLLLPYFLAGVLFAMWRPAGISNAARLLAFALFVVLVPFWHRTEASPLVGYLPQVLHPRVYNAAFHYLVGFAGTLAFVEMARLIVQHAPARIVSAGAFLGRRSLDIYALHFYALGWFPPVAAAVAFSIVGSAILRTNPLTSRLFFGEWAAPPKAA
ncbi:MAG TPA: acyltransferase [Bosea sp. (in: a-proteobacteria)]|uniref:acyltransferase n=1 Tax=Bosea sp. (in: a-proteobacteria) TaxID=1871050 RepID=UPI002E106770|nr:acyltransferase [Bosea sp. (in: a-proteobacteria)]